MVSVKYAPAQAPFIGTGRWTMQIPELKNEDLMKRITNRGMTLQTKLSDPSRAQTPRDEGNTQSLWAAFKNDVVKITKKHCSKSRGKLEQKIMALEKDLKEIAKNTELDTNNNVRAEEAFLAKKLALLKRIQAKDKKDETRAAVANHGEVLGGIWSGMNKDRKPRDLIPRLKIPSPPGAQNNSYERDSRQMAKLARDYHKALQSQDIAYPDKSPDLIRKTHKEISEVPACQRLTTEEAERTEWLITYPQVWKALSLTKTARPLA